MEYSNARGYYFPLDYSYVSQGMQIPTFNTVALDNAMRINPQDINRIVEVEMKRMKEDCLHNEQEYVEQMLLENPITLERRINNHQPQISSDDELLDVVTVNSATKKNVNTFLQQQRAEACRRSRYNNKIRKAKTKYRHNFMSQKLIHTCEMFDCIQNLIIKAENHLLTQGLTRDKLEYLRQTFGLETANTGYCN